MEMHIGANIKRLRTLKNVTQEELSRAMNVTCAAVSKWERGETFPDITLLCPLAYYFGVTLDELMSYDREKINAEIDETMAHYRSLMVNQSEGMYEFIADAYRKYPESYPVMSAYMWAIAGGSADNDPEVLLGHKDEFLSICRKILDGCTDDRTRHEAYNMQAKLLHAEGKTDEALALYESKFANWYETSGQKSEQLFAKDTDEYYLRVRKNMFQLADFAADKLGRSVFFDKSLTMREKAEKSLLYGDLMLGAFDATHDDFFLVIAYTFLSRMENDLYYRGGSDEDVIAVMDAHLSAAQKVSRRICESEALRAAFSESMPYWLDQDTDLIDWLLGGHRTPKGRRAQLLNLPAYTSVLDKYGAAEK